METLRSEVAETYNASALPEVYLRPGELFLVHEPTIIRTILGSCIGITFWCPRLGIGGLCHCMLPREPKNPSARKIAEIGRYVDSCIREFGRRFDDLGARRGEIQVKLFGGADVLLAQSAATGPSVGKLNCEVAIEILRNEGFEVIASSLGGALGCKIAFNTQTGEVLLLRLT